MVIRAAQTAKGKVFIQTTNSRFALAMEKIQLLDEVERLKEEVLVR